MSKCACGEDSKHISILYHIHETRIRCVHNGLSDIGILCSQDRLAFLGVFDLDRLSNFQDGRGKHNSEYQFI